MIFSSSVIHKRSHVPLSAMSHEIYRGHRIEEYLLDSIMIETRKSFQKVLLNLLDGMVKTRQHFELNKIQNLVLEYVILIEQNACMINCMFLSPESW